MYKHPKTLPEVLHQPLAFLIIDPGMLDAAISSDTPLNLKFRWHLLFFTSAFQSIFTPTNRGTF